MAFSSALLDSLAAWFRDAFLDPLALRLREMQAPLDAFLSQVSPAAARGCAVALFVLAAGWVWTIRRDFIYRGAPDRAAWRDLRWWTLLALLPYVVIYLFFF